MMFDGWKEVIPIVEDLCFFPPVAASSDGCVEPPGSEAAHL